MNQTKTLMLSGALIIIVGAGAFYGGMRYEKSKNPFASFQRSGEANGGRLQMMGGQGQGGGNRVMRNGGGLVAGEIIKKDDKSITVKLPDGGSKTIYYSDTTTVSKSTDGTKDDLTEGNTVMVTGTVNADGSVVAQNVQIRPEGSPATPGLPEKVDSSLDDKK